jgi:hypothetical protein
MNTQPSEASPSEEKEDPRKISSASSRTGTPLVSTEFSLRWTRAVNTFRKPLYDLLHVLSRVSANNPKRTFGFVTFFSVALLLVGVATNFRMDSDNGMYISFPTCSRCIINAAITLTDNF